MKMQPSSSAGSSPWTTKQVLNALLGAGLGGGLALICLFAYYRWNAPTRLPQLTDSDLAAAAHQWRDHELRDYLVRIRVTGRQPAEYQVEVRDGVPRQATRNGNPLTSERTFGTWAVPGMLQTIRSDLQNQPTLNLELRAEFDKQLGYPLRYQRTELRSYGNEPLRWEVTEFRPLPAQVDEAQSSP